MRLEVITTVEEAGAERLDGRLVIAVDVLRATTTVVTALAHGVLGVWPVPSPAEAEALARSMEPGTCLRGGERGSFRLPGFDLGNSPLEYTAERVRGKHLILTTTNGTATIRRASCGSLAAVASLLNGHTVGTWAARQELDVVVLCAGTRGRFSLDDVLCAGQVTDALVEARHGAVELCDLAVAARQLYIHHRADLPGALRSTEHGRRLQTLGFSADVVYAAQAELWPVVPAYADGVVRLTSWGPGE